ncbi:isochorismatase family protein [Candidatus Borreliella tachyglossi]|uniref:isochorismatase family protein n=1 Tax=Candidatus Borreliella tachyglossi TaxID=1964448 RepID=UPI0040437D7C
MFHIKNVKSSFFSSLNASFFLLSFVYDLLIQVITHHILFTKKLSNPVFKENKIRLQRDRYRYYIHKSCIQGTRRAEFPNNLNVEKIRNVFLKGQDKNSDSYSGFYNDSTKGKSTGLFSHFKSNLINTVFVVGLALDFCVKETIIDAYNLGFRFI